jgi:hypothetical protein
MSSTRNLLAKTFCFTRQLRWDAADGLEPLINPKAVKTLHSELQHRPPLEVERASKELGITLVQAHEC